MADIHDTTFTDVDMEPPGTASASVRDKAPGATPPMKRQKTISAMFEALKVTPKFTPKELKTLADYAARAIIFSPTALPANFWRQPDVVECLRRYARQPSEDGGLTYGHPQPPGKYAVDSAILRMFHLYRTGLTRDLEGLYEAHWELPFATVAHDIWTGPRQQPVLGLTIHFRDQYFNMVHAPLLVSSGLKTHEAKEVAAYSEERVQKMYRISLSKYLHRVMSDTTNSAVAVSDVLTLERTKEEEERSEDPLVMTFEIDSVQKPDVTIMDGNDCAFAQSVGDDSVGFQIGDEIFCVRYSLNGEEIDCKIKSKKNFDDVFEMRSPAAYPNFLQKKRVDAGNTWSRT